MRDPILIAGCARSGTSLTAGLVHYCGAFGGKLVGQTKYNEKGFFENAYIRNGMIKPYLSSIGCDPRGQYPLPDIENITAYLPLQFIVNWRKKFFDIFLNQGWDKQTPIYFKEPKMVLVWPIFNLSFPRSKWVIVRRKDEEVISSCLQTGFMNHYRNRAGWQKWLNHHKARFEEMKEANLDIFEFWPEKLFTSEALTYARELIEWLELEWNEKEIVKFITPRLWNNKKRKG